MQKLAQTPIQMPIQVLIQTPIPKNNFIPDFDKGTWKEIAIAEDVINFPKELVVVSSEQRQGKAKAFPAYNYKDGFGELAKLLPPNHGEMPIVKVRPEVKIKLDAAQKILDENDETKHLQLVVLDGYRNLKTQQKLFDTYKSYLAKTQPHHDEKTLNVLAQKMVSIVPETKEALLKAPPPHSTGGSVDVVLFDKTKNEMVNFGADFDEMMHPIYGEQRSRTDYYEEASLELSPFNIEAQKHRRILYNLMIGQGFTNDPFEFWHYDYGNQLNALSTGNAEAQFGLASF